MKQILLDRDAVAISGSSTRYGSLVNLRGDVGTVEDSVDRTAKQIVLSAALARNFFVTNLTTPPPVGATRTNTLRVNGADTAVVLTQAAGVATASYTGADIALAANDLVNWKEVWSGLGGSHAYNQRHGFELETTGSDYLWQHFHTVNGISVGASALYGGLFDPVGPSTTTQANGVSYMPMDGEVLGYGAYVRSQQTFAGTTWGATAVIFKNGVAQDGTGGTPDTTLTLFAAAMSAAICKTSFTLPFSRGDSLQLRYVRATAGHDPNLFGGLTILCASDEAGVSGVFSRTVSSGTISGSSHQQVARGDESFNTLESDRMMYHGGPTPFVLDHLRATLIGSGPGVGLTRTFSVRRSLSSTVLLPTGVSASITGAAAGVAYDATHQVDVTQGQTLSVRTTASGSTTACQTTLSMQQRVGTLARFKPQRMGF